MNITEPTFSSAALATESHNGSIFASAHQMQMGRLPPITTDKKLADAKMSAAAKMRAGSFDLMTQAQKLSIVVSYRATPLGFVAVFTPQLAAT